MAVPRQRGSRSEWRHRNGATRRGRVGCLSCLGRWNRGVPVFSWLSVGRALDALKKVAFRLARLVGLQVDDGTEPIADDEFLYRRIVERWYDPSAEAVNP